MKIKSFNILTFILLCTLTVSALASGKDSKTSNKKSAIRHYQVIGHAHMDMNWLWTASETMQMCNDNLRQVVAFMKEFPDYTMLQSQASVYSIL